MSVKQQHKIFQTQKSYREGGAGCGQTLGARSWRKVKKMGKSRGGEIESIGQWW